MESISMYSHINYICTISLKYDLNRLVYIPMLIKWYYGLIRH